MTGSFTVIGLVIGYWLDFRKEKWHYIQENENRKNETEEENRKAYLSPLCFYLNKNSLSPISASTRTFKDLKNEPIYGAIESNITAIEELMKTNMHILPINLNFDLNLYLANLKGLSVCMKKIQKIIGEADEAEKVALPERFREDLEKLNKQFNEMTATLLASIYAIMKFNIPPTEKENEAFHEKDKQITEVLTAIIADLDLEVKKLKQKTIEKPTT